MTHEEAVAAWEELGERELDAELVELVPGEEAQAAMARHANEHGRHFDLARDVSYLGNEPAHPLFSWHPARQSYHCAEHPGTVYYVSWEPSPAFLRSLLRDPALQPFLAGPKTQAERLEIARRYLRGDLSEALLAPARRRERMRTAQAGRPEVAARRRRCQRFLLAAYGELGTVSKAINALLSLHASAPEQYRAIMGGDPLYAFETLLGHWKAIDPEVRDQAKERYRAAREAKRRTKDTR